MRDPNTGAAYGEPYSNAEIQSSFQKVYGRVPTETEITQAKTLFSPETGWSSRETVLERGLSQMFGNQSQQPQTGASITSTSQSVNQPSLSPYAFNPSGTYSPVPVTGGDNRTFATNYTPSVDSSGNVAKFIPQGLNYTPTQYATTTPTQPTQGGLTQAFPASSTTSGVNVPNAPTEGSYGNIPLNSTGLGTMTIGGGTGEGGVAFPTFTFNFAAEQADAYARLKPFYEKLLSFAGGRVDLAQRILEYTYQQGMRESRQEYEQSAKEQALTFPAEQESMKTTQNQRGIMTSGFGKTEQSRLTQSQDLRREAIERALENRESRLVSQRGFGLEEKQLGFEEEKFGQERERRQESSELAEKKFSIKQAEYQSALDKALRSEQKAIRESDRAFQIKLAKGEF